MRQNFYFFTFLVIIFVAASNLSYGQQTFKTTPTSVIGYLEYLPADYNSNSNKYPIVIFLHGIGERGPNTTNVAELEKSIKSLTKLGPPKHVAGGTQFPFILISPQLKNNYSKWPSSYVMEVINHVKTYLRVDERKIHVTGLSMGGGGVWVVAQDYPELFASASPVCGAYNSPSLACKLAGENLPVWAFHGDKDDVVSYNTSVKMVNAINACTPASNPQAKLTIYPGVEHDSWTQAYNTGHTYHNPNIYEWMMSFSNTVNRGNKIPVANAGSDRTIYTKSVSLSGSATDADGTIASWKWKQISGPSATLANADTKILSVSSMSAGTYMFRLQVTDNSGNTDSDYVKVVVDLTNKVPVVSAGADVTIIQPPASSTLTGTASDPDGTIAAWNWSFVSGPATPAISGATTSKLTVSDLIVPGTYVYRLKVTDDKGATASDNVSIIVNALPVSNAGPDVTIVHPKTTITLTGSGSDADGTVVSYEWRFSKGPVTPALKNAKSTTVEISGLTVAGSYVFNLRVQDNLGAKVYDHITVHVLPEKTTAKSTVSSMRQSADAALEAEDVDPVKLLSSSSDEYWQDKKVSVYNENGSSVYSGAWSSEKYAELAARPGLYICRIDSVERSITYKIIIRN